jgi:thiol-disulfide isomerase/thioredoxin
MSVTIEYIGAEWCKSCKTIFPKVETLAKKFSIELQSKDFDIDLQENEKETVSKLPTVRIHKESKVIQEYSTNQVASLETWLQKNTTLNDSDF